MINIYDLKCDLNTEKVKIKNSTLISVNTSEFKDEKLFSIDVRVLYEKNEKIEKEIWKIKLINWKEEDVKNLEKLELQKINLEDFKIKFTPYLQNDRIQISMKSER